jgi:hypothetical protein
MACGYPRIRALSTAAAAEARLSPLSGRGVGKLADDLEKERDAEDDANAAISTASAAVARSFFYIDRRANPQRVTAWNGSPATLILAAAARRDLHRHRRALPAARYDPTVRSRPR